MTWLLAFLGFALLIILHEAGHFFAAKAVGMRVERFALFFPEKRPFFLEGVDAFRFGTTTTLDDFTPSASNGREATPSVIIASSTTVIIGEATCCPTLSTRYDCRR